MQELLCVILLLFLCFRFTFQLIVLVPEQKQIEGIILKYTSLCQNYGRLKKTLDRNVSCYFFQFTVIFILYASRLDWKNTRIIPRPKSKNKIAFKRSHPLCISSLENSIDSIDIRIFSFRQNGLLYTILLPNK